MLEYLLSNNMYCISLFENVCGYLLLFLRTLVDGSHEFVTVCCYSEVS